MEQVFKKVNNFDKTKELMCLFLLKIISKYLKYKFRTFHLNGYFLLTLNCII